MPLSRRAIQPLIRRALAEDRADADATSRAVLPSALRIRARVLAKAPGVVAGAPVAAWTFSALDRSVRCRIVRPDGARVAPGSTILTVEGPARAIFAAERTALNFLGHLSGIATLTNEFVRRVPRATKILDTRKTLPGLRRLEKYAVRVGGGHSHRADLREAVLIKTNHLRAIRRQPSAISQAVRRARARAPRRFIEVEVTNLRGFNAALHARPHAILLDNWTIASVRKAVALRNQSPITHHPSSLLEVSGGVTLANVRAIARTGVERISIGRLTHSAPALDVALEVVGKG